MMGPSMGFRPLPWRLLAILSAAAAAPLSLPAQSPLVREAAALGKPSWRPMLVYVARLHERATHPPEPPFAYPWEEIGPGYGIGPAFGHWDLVHEMLDELPAWPGHVREQLLNDLGLQLPNGFLPGSVYMPGSPSAPMGQRARRTHYEFDRGEEGHPPVWVVAAGDYLALHPDPALEADFLDHLVRQIGWFEASRRARTGGFFYNDIVLHKWESGVDDGVRFDRTSADPPACVDATSHVYWLYAYAAQWSRELGRNPEPWQSRAGALTRFIRTRLWDPSSGFFYDSWAAGDPSRQTGAFEGIWPVVVGAATPEQAQRVIEGWILNPRRLFTPHPIATVARDDPRFSLRMWRGPAWNSMTYWAARGCVRYGRPDAARALLEAALDDSAAQFARTGTVWEYYHPEDGHPEALARKPYTRRNQPWPDYLGHNPLLAMARLWAECSPAR